VLLPSTTAATATAEGTVQDFGSPAAAAAACSEVILHLNGAHYTLSILNHEQKVYMYFDSLGRASPPDVLSPPAGYRQLILSQRTQSAATCGPNALFVALAYIADHQRLRTSCRTVAPAGASRGKPEDAEHLGQQQQQLQPQGHGEKSEQQPQSGPNKDACKGEKKRKKYNCNTSSSGSDDLTSGADVCGEVEQQSRAGKHQQDAKKRMKASSAAKASSVQRSNLSSSAPDNGSGPSNNKLIAATAAGAPATSSPTLQTPFQALQACYYGAAGNGASQIREKAHTATHYQPTWHGGRTGGPWGMHSGVPDASATQHDKLVSAAYQAALSVAQPSIA
jgi:hypothetical protein